jgi:hypothetical protein
MKATFMLAALIAGTAGAEMPQKEKEELRRAEMTYKTQMQYQWKYPKEAEELKKEYKAQVARIKSKFESNQSKPVMFLATPDSMKMKAELREAKDRYLTQMQYQGQYPKEAADLKRQYEKDVARIKSGFASRCFLVGLNAEMKKQICKRPRTRTRLSWNTRARIQAKLRYLKKSMMHQKSLRL